MPAAWKFPQTTPYQVQGRDLSEDNFAQEDRSALEILIREALQNPIDARASNNSGPVDVRISVLGPERFDTGYLTNLLNTEYGKRLEASGGVALPDLASTSVLVIEDFGTTGLEGTWNDQNADGSGENWNAFWFREGEGAKSAAGSNGRAGQGKITYYRVGDARAVFGLTVRQSDGARLLMGRSAFRRVYPYIGHKFQRHSFWCSGSTYPAPVLDDAEIEAFRLAFALERTHEPGLSLVIPCPTAFDPQLAIRKIITEFYFPIACGNLAVTIGGMKIGTENIDRVAEMLLPDDVARTERSCFTKGFRKLARKVIEAEQGGFQPTKLKRGWDKAATLKEEDFPEGALAELRAATERGEHVSVRFPVDVRQRGSKPAESWFDVHIEIPDDLDRVEEAYIRRDLLIGSENHLAASSHLQKARGLTLIKDSTLSAFLADAEEPTHLKWNASRPRLAEDYSNPQGTLRAVRNAAPRLLTLLSNGLVKRDIKALAKYFTHQGDSGSPRSPGGTKQGGRNAGGPSSPPPPARKPFRLKTGMDCVTVLPNGDASLAPNDLPFSCVLELAYEGVDQDPFKAYDPFDFDLSNKAAHTISVTGITVFSREGNRINFEVIEPDFSMQVDGFDTHIRLRARLTFKEKSSGTGVSEE